MQQCANSKLEKELIELEADRTLNEQGVERIARQEHEKAANLR